MSSNYDQSALLQKIFKLRDYYLNGDIPTLTQHEVNPNLDKGSRENYLYFTLPHCLNFQRSSPAMWAAALKTYEDPETNYLFFPEYIADHNREQIQIDLAKHKLSLQKNKHTDIWISISKAFHKLYDDDPRNLLIKGDWDIQKIHTIIQETQATHFPYLRGPKLAHYWLYILKHYTDATFKNLNALSIIPDTHILQSSQVLGISLPSDSPVQVAEKWRELLEGSRLAPVDMHAVLWNWSRNNFMPEV